MLTILLQLYPQPIRGMSRILDEGRFLFALALAACVSLLLPTSLFLILATIAFAFVPAAIVAVNLFDSLGGAGVILSRDYMSVLVCALMGWTAAVIPVGLLRFAPMPLGLELPLMAAGGLYFLFLSVCALRTVMDTDVHWGRAIDLVASTRDE